MPKIKNAFERAWGIRAHYKIDRYATRNLEISNETFDKNVEKYLPRTGGNERPITYTYHAQFRRI